MGYNFVGDIMGLSSFF